MTGREKLAFAGGAAIIIGTLIGVMVKNPAALVVSSCDPYVLFVVAGDAHPLQYYRFDGATRPLSVGFVVGHYIDAMGANHTQGYVLDWGQGKMEAPGASGNKGADGWPYPTFPAPPIDALVEHQPPEGGVTVCGNYTKWNGPHAKPCPSNPALYSAAIKALSQTWIPPGTGCGHFPTPTPTGGPASTPTQTSTLTPIVPTPPPTVKPTITSTATVTRTPTKTPCQVCIPCTPTSTPHIGPAPSKTPTPKLGH